MMFKSVEFGVVLFLVHAGAFGAAHDATSCVHLEDDGERVACYDAALGRQTPPIEAPTPAQAVPREPFEVTTPAQAPSEPVDATRPALPATRGPSLGEEQLRVEQPRTHEAAQVRSVITSVAKRLRGEWVLELQNGQAWTQVEVGRFSAREGDTVTVERGRLGGYVLTVNGGRSTHVRRIR